jgi:hypothetical protein
VGSDGDGAGDPAEPEAVGAPDADPEHATATASASPARGDVRDRLGRIRRTIAAAVRPFTRAVGTRRAA